MLIYMFHMDHIVLHGPRFDTFHRQCIDVFYSMIHDENIFMKITGILRI